MKKIVILTLLAISSLAKATEYEVINGSKYNSNEIYFTNANTGERMETFYKNGKTYVAGKIGDNYEINLCGNSRSYGRNLYVISVDGLNVVSGEPANYNQTGYVISNNSGCSKIKGWRKNMNEEARFVITSSSGSYAAKTNHDQKNLGIIGFAMFNEEIQTQIVTPLSSPIATTRSKSSSPNGAIDSSNGSSVSPAVREVAKDVMSMKKEEQAGTGHGERISSAATKTEFKKATDKPNRVSQFYYDSYENLISKGIISVRQEQPNPFPAEIKFAPDPKN